MLVRSLILIQSDKHTHSGKQNIQVTLCRICCTKKNLLVILLAASRLLQRLSLDHHANFSENTLELLAQW